MIIVPFEAVSAKKEESIKNGMLNTNHKNHAKKLNANC